ncbi:hypothetical protein [Rhizobium sp. BG4]|uniref:hypothetical protein n=1 Tax=Rhizobium sp. BG4 TaxID=2613770 RepID=UPI00193D2704|nr:hypothetical protein [Rhizobium sp. BG4]QRM44013.1 hypothetical protein F2982_11455 [Rhizobium sp. BG4]
MRNVNDSITFLTGWAAEIRASSGNSVDADCLEYAATNLAEQASEIDRLRAALTKISSPTQTTGLLWWQVEARAALSAEVEG